METSCSEDKETLLELVWIARCSDESRWPTLITTPSTLLMVRMALISLVDNINGPSASSEYVDGLSVWMGVEIRFGRSHNLQASSKCYRNCGEGCGYAPYVILVFFWIRIELFCSEIRSGWFVWDRMEKRMRNAIHFFFSKLFAMICVFIDLSGTVYNGTQIVPKTVEGIQLLEKNPNVQYCTSNLSIELIWNRFCVECNESYQGWTLWDIVLHGTWVYW